MRVPLSVIILTYNEELNLRHCLESIADWADEIIVVDSLSTDKTREIAKKFGAHVFEHAFEGYAAQRNWALAHTHIKNEWVLVLDADERPTEELKNEIREVLKDPGGAHGFYLKRKFVFLGRWIRHGGYYPVWLLRFFRHAYAHCEDKLVDEHYIVTGRTGHLRHDIIHDDKRGVSDWVLKHNRYATLKAQEFMKAQKNEGASSHEKTRARKIKAWKLLPPFFRPFLYFVYIYFFRLGFLDGVPGLAYHVLRGFWFPFLIDVKMYEMKLWKNMY